MSPTRTTVCPQFIYLFINYNTITNYILIIYELSNFSGGNRIHDPHTNSPAHYPLDYQGTQCMPTIRYHLRSILSKSDYL